MKLSELYNGVSKHGKIPPAYEPKVTFRVSDSRSKQIVEFSLPVPIEGYYPELLNALAVKFLPIAQKMFYVPIEQLGEVDNGEEEKISGEDEARSQSQGAKESGDHEEGRSGESIQPQDRGTSPGESDGGG